MFSVLIVEDNVIIRKQVAELLYNMGVQVSEASNAQEAKIVLSKKIPDVVFFDINLPDSNGFNLAEQLSIQYPNVGVVFITGYKDFAHKAFEIDAIDYLIKPFSQERFRECIKKVYTFLNATDKKNQNQSYIILAVKVNKGIELIEQKNIAYINAEGKYSFINTIGGKNKKIKTTEPLKLIETKLDPNYFIRTHRSYITNLNHISKIESSGQTNLIYFKTCTDIAYLSKNHMVSLYKKINFR
ncbi:LytR/AlgR family response regulator transcription factor [Solibacillus sp. FSL K6-1126]|uniref:LytR/AlgR family response regulator transcription factor n=1 Tax=Solibacillus sp. FSL K6-1126 TaxID=2921463 RepID=UPI0030F649A6